MKHNIAWFYILLLILTVPSASTRLAHGIGSGERNYHFNRQPDLR
jgi:hypothetical protein